MQKALGRFSSLVGRQACSSLGVRGFQATEAAAAPIPIDSEPYCRQRNELVLGTRIPVKAPDAWVAPTAVIIGDVDLYERVCHHLVVMSCGGYLCWKKPRGLLEIVRMKRVKGGFICV